MPLLFQSMVAIPPGMAVKSWCEVERPDRLFSGLEPSMLTRPTLPPVFCTLRASMYICLASQLMCERLVADGPVLHQTGVPSASRIVVKVPPNPGLVMMKPLACAAAFMIVTVGLVTLAGIAPVMIMLSWPVQVPAPLETVIR